MLYFNKAWINREQITLVCFDGNELVVYINGTRLYLCGIRMPGHCIKDFPELMGKILYEVGKNDTPSFFKRENFTKWVKNTAKKYGIDESNIDVAF